MHYSLLLKCVSYGTDLWGEKQKQIVSHQLTSQYNQNPRSMWEQYSIVNSIVKNCHFLPFPGKIYSHVWVLLSLFCSLNCQAAGKFKSLVQVKCDHKRQWYQDLSEMCTIGFEGKSEFHTLCWNVKFSKYFSPEWDMDSDFLVTVCTNTEVFAVWSLIDLHVEWNKNNFLRSRWAIGFSMVYFLKIPPSTNLTCL